MKHIVKNTYILRKALSMIEVIFVIIVLGVVASIGSQIIADVYGSYIVERGQYRSNIKTELALNQIANRLRYAIPGTLGYRTALGAGFVNLSSTTAVPATATVLQWVGYDGDSFEAMSSGAANGTTRRPGWSGFCDINSPQTTQTNIHTPGSNINLAAAIIGNLAAGGLGAVAPRIFFPDGTNYLIAGSVDPQQITLNPGIPAGSEIYERYKLAWTSYALSVEGGDLFLYHNFAPIPGTNNFAGIQRNLLMENIANFRFRVTEGAIRIKICKSETTFDANGTVHACKEKVIF